MNRAHVEPAKLRLHSNDLRVDVIRRIGWYVRYPNGTTGPRQRTRAEAAAEARWWNGQPPNPSETWRRNTAAAAKRAIRRGPAI